MTKRLMLRSLLTAATLSLAACGGTESDSSALSAESMDLLGAADGSGKVTLCHVPPGNPANAHTITVGAPAVKAHLAHGDVLGPCGGYDAGTGGDGSGGGDTDGGFDEGTGGGDGQTDAGTGGDTGNGGGNDAGTDGGSQYN